jgi:hypothetical protein
MQFWFSRTIYLPSFGKDRRSRNRIDSDWDYSEVCEKPN